MGNKKDTELNAELLREYGQNGAVSAPLDGTAAHYARQLYRGEGTMGKARDLHFRDVVVSWSGLVNTVSGNITHG